MRGYRKFQRSFGAALGRLLRPSRQMAKHSRACIRSLLDLANADLAKKPFTDHNYRCTIPDMPHASRRYTSVRRRSDRASADGQAFDELSRILNDQAPGRESQFRTPDPNRYFRPQMKQRQPPLIENRTRMLRRVKRLAEEISIHKAKC